MFEIDELTLYRGKDIELAKGIILHQPTLGEIQEFGERNYFGAINNITSVGADMKWQLWDIGIDYTEISDYELFINHIVPLISSRKSTAEKILSGEIDTGEKKYTDEDIKELMLNPVSLFLPNIDFADFVMCKEKATDDIILYNPESDITVNKIIYNILVDAIRKIHILKRNNVLPGNERTKMDMIEDDRDEYIANKRMPYKSSLLNLISSAVNSSGFSFNHNDVWDMKIFAFFDSIKRLCKIQDSTLLLQGAYSGFSDLKNIDKDKLNWLSDIT